MGTVSIDISKMEIHDIDVTVKEEERAIHFGIRGSIHDLNLDDLSNIAGAELTPTTLVCEVEANADG